MPVWLDSGGEESRVPGFGVVTITSGCVLNLFYAYLRNLKRMKNSELHSECLHNA